MKVDVIQTSFAAGEFGPSLFGRTDIAQYANACAIVENFLPRSYGPAISMPGTTYVYTVSNSTLVTRLIKFVFNRADSYVIEMGKNYFRFYTNGGIVITTGTTPFTLYHVYSDTELFDVQFTQLNDVVWMTHPDHPPQKLIRYSATNWTISDAPIIGGPFLNDNTPSVTSSGVSASTITITASATTGTVNLTVSPTNSSLFTVSGSTLGHHGSYWMIGGLAQTNSTTGLQEIGYVRITYVTNSYTATATVIKNLKVSTATNVWAEGAFSAVRGYPGKVTFHGRRLYYARTAYEPQKQWGSVVYEYDNFALNTQADDDALNLPLASNESNEIQWLASGKALIAGTYGGAFVTNSGSTDPITPNNASATEETGFGSSSIIPRKIGNLLFYIQRFGKKLRETFYDFATDTYKAVDRTILSPHVLGDGVVDMDVQQNPESILYCVLTSGTLATMTRELDQQVTAWARHTTTGTYTSITVIPSQTNSYDEAWVLVERWINGTQKKYVEVFDSIDVPDRQDMCNYMHSSLLYDSATIPTANIAFTDFVEATTYGNLVLTPSNYKFATRSAYLDGSGDFMTFPDSADFDFSNGEGSCYFDGTGDYLTTPDHADFNFGSSDFTIEFFVNFSSITWTRTIVSQWSSATSQEAFLFGWSPNTFYFYYSTDGTGGTIVNHNFSYTPTAGVWYHVALCRNGNNLRCFVNGSQVGSTADMTGVTIFDSTYDFQIGIQESVDNAFHGFIDELRISDTARYTSNFTPTTTAFTTDANTKYLLHFSGVPGDAITDSSGGGKVTTKGGNADISKTKYLFIAGWTVDFWIYPVAFGASDYYIWSQRTDAANNIVLLYDGGLQALRFLIIAGGSTVVDVRGNTSKPVTGAWSHIEVCQSGDTYKIFVNGVDETASGGTDTDRPANYAAVFNIGALNVTNRLNAYIDEFRVSNGICRHTTSFTPPTEEYTTDSYTKLLLHLNDNVMNTAYSVPYSTTVTSSTAAFSQAQVGKRLRVVNSAGDVLGIASIAATVSTTSITVTVTTQFLSKRYSAGEWGVSVSSISSLDHLEGEVVGVLADGTLDETTKDVRSGSITLSDDYFVVRVGKLYDQIIKTLPKEAGSQRGTAQGKIQRINQLALKVNRSYVGMYVGQDESNIDQLQNLDGIDSDFLYTGVIPNISLINDYKYGDTVYIKNSAPLPVELLSIISTLDTYDK